MDENKELILSKSFELEIEGFENHKEMIELINASLPKLYESTKNFNKTQSQFMDNMLTVSHPTPIRNLRQILAETNKSLMALNEAKFKLLKEQIEIKKLQRSLGKENDSLEKEYLHICIEEKRSMIKISMGYVSGAIRKIANYVNQFNEIMKSIGKDRLSEVDFEAEEERYHIMTAFNQALCAARSHGGIIDEGNHIYFSQIGISGFAAQVEIHVFLEYIGMKAKEENGIIEFRDQIKWLNSMAEKYKGCATNYCKEKGMFITTDVALLK